MNGKIIVGGSFYATLQESFFQFFPELGLLLVESFLEDQFFWFCARSLLLLATKYVE